MPIRTKAGAALLNARIRSLRRQLPLALDGDLTGVHRARVASRRLREAIPVLAGGLKRGKPRKAARKVRRLTRALGAVRELDVTACLLDELGANQDVPRAAIEEVRAHVFAQRIDHRKAMLARIEDLGLDRLNRRLDAVGGAMPFDTSEQWPQRLAARLLKRSKVLVDRVTTAGQLYAPEHLHQVRIATKKLRYALELALEAQVSSASTHVRTLKRIQGTLGRLHDLQVLQAHVTAVQTEAPARSPLHAGLAALAAHIEEQCRILHGRYVRTAPQLSDTAETVRTQIVPALASASRPLKMDLPQRRSAASGLGS